MILKKINNYLVHYEDDNGRDTKTYSFHRRLIEYVMLLQSPRIGLHSKVNISNVSTLEIPWDPIKCLVL